MCISSIDRFPYPAILSIAMGSADRRWRWVCLLLAGLPLGCICGGQTGECFGGDSDGNAPLAAFGTPSCNNARPVSYQEPTGLGYTAADMLSALGGQHTATASTIETGFWEALAIAEPEAAAIGLAFSIAYADGSVTVNECDHTTSVVVDVTLQFGDGLLARSGAATLKGSPHSATLLAELLPPAEDDGSQATVTLNVTLAPGTVSGTLLAGPAATTPLSPAAWFGGE